MAKNFDKTVKKMCAKKLSSPDENILGDTFSVQEAIAEGLIRKALSGASDAVKLIREILSNEKEQSGGFRVDINVIE